jgi:hypothetical protein
MNPRLHRMIDQVVATQVVGGDPPEMFETAEPLIAARRNRTTCSTCSDPR